MYQLTRNGRIVIISSFDHIWRYFVERYGHMNLASLSEFKIERVNKC